MYMAVLGDRLKYINRNCCEKKRIAGEINSEHVIDVRTAVPKSEWGCKCDVILMKMYKPP